MKNNFAEEEEIKHDFLDFGRDEMRMTWNRSIAINVKPLIR